MEKKIDLYSCLYDAADSIVENAEKEIIEAVNETLDEYRYQDLEELRGMVIEFPIGELNCDGYVDIEYFCHGRGYGSDKVRAYLTVDLSIELNVYQLLAKGVFEGESSIDYAMLETKYDDVELEDDQLGDLQEEMDRALREGIDWSEFKRG